MGLVNVTRVGVFDGFWTPLTSPSFFDGDISPSWLMINTWTFINRWERAESRRCAKKGVASGFRLIVSLGAAEITQPADEKCPNSERFAVVPLLIFLILKCAYG